MIRWRKSIFEPKLSRVTTYCCVLPTPGTRTHLPFSRCGFVHCCPSPRGSVARLTLAQGVSGRVSYTFDERAPYVDPCRQRGGYSYGRTRGGALVGFGEGYGILPWSRQPTPMQSLQTSLNEREGVQLSLGVGKLYAGGMERPLRHGGSWQFAVID